MERNAAGTGIAGRDRLLEAMVRIPGGTFQMGSDVHYPEEAPAHDVRVNGFWMDTHAVTNTEFRRFVDATNYVTFAEKPANAADYPGAKPELLAPSSVMFRRTTGPVDMRNAYNWWTYVAGAVYEMAGNVWEWTTDWYQEHGKIQHACCTLDNPCGGMPDESRDPRTPDVNIPRRVMKGGSYLCAPNYCQRYRPAARMAQPIDTST